MTLNDIVDKFNTTPFLFVGSGISRRYLGLPDWKGLLEHFAREVRDDDFSYSAYVSKARENVPETDVMPEVASLIEKDFNELWYKDQTKRHLDPEELKKVKNGASPFKAEIASYEKHIASINADYDYEISTLKELAEKSVSGIITTNYDTFLENTFTDYQVFVGQKQLIFSPLQGVAEIYKIHGSVNDPESIVIDAEDYQEFDAKEKYLAAKLMTIFMEYPIVFLGYSISDRNILSIIKSILDCLDSEQIRVLENRFIFVEYDEGHKGVDITPYTFMPEDKPLQMTRVTLSDFSELYRALARKKTQIPVRLLRHFKQELYQYVITNRPTGTMRVASIDDGRVSDEDMVLAIGKASEFGLKGLSGLDVNEWYRNVVMDDLDFTADELLTYAYPKLIKTNSNKLPLCKLLSEADGEYIDAREHAAGSFDEIIPKTYRESRHRLGYNSVKEVWENEKGNLNKAARLLAYLPEDKVDVNELEKILKGLFEEKNFLDDVGSEVRTNVRRLIRMYDYLKWGK